MSSPYPDHAPQCLRYEYEQMAAAEDAELPEALLPILERLVYRPEMAKVWDSLARHSPDSQATDDETREREAWLLFGEIKVAMSGPIPWEKLTKGQRAKQCREIQRCAEALAALLRDTPYDTSPYRYLSDTHARLLIGQFRKNRKPSTDESAADTLARQFALRPPFSDLLTTLASSITDEPPAIAAYPNRLRPNRTFLLRWLIKFTSARYGQPLYANVAIIASAVLDEDIPRDAARDAVR